MYRCLALVGVLLSCSHAASTPSQAPIAAAPQPAADAGQAAAPAPEHAAADAGQAAAPAAAHDHAAMNAPPITLASLAGGALMLPDLGDHHRAVSTRSPGAQRYFDQGLRLTYGFNHDEAARSYAKAAQLDPGCAMCFWGTALTLGPNYNIPMLPDRAQAAWDALSRARALASQATPVEQALIAALAKRYQGPEPLDPPAMQPFTEAYGAAMREVARKFPADDDVQVLFAESLMNIHPWKLWSLDGKPGPQTGEIVSTLEKVLARAPRHPGANHYYIHAVEASPNPGRAERAADRLAGLMPGAGHIVHMPAHIYQRVGRYEDAAEQNRRAIRVDQAYLAAAKPFGYYPMYLGHNQAFLAFATSMEGRQAETLAAAHAAVKTLPHEVICTMPGMDFFLSAPIFAELRFGRWDELLEEPRPEAKYQVLTGLWLHGRGFALAAKGRLDEARAALAELEKLAASVPKEMTADLSPAPQLLEVASKALAARIAQQAHQPDALALWADAVAAADKLPYSEPADWFYPLRHHQGAALLAAGKGAEAEQVYREDLRRNPKNGWALDGLARALALEKRNKEAQAIRAQFREAWKHADIAITSSAF